MTIKRAFWLAAMTVLSLTTHAQHFDWVKSYTGSDRPGLIDNWIVGSVTDSDGNLYILGQCASNAQLDGISLVPLGYPNRNCILIAKVSPDGDILWHKSISSAGECGAYSIKMVGDTSITCMVGITLKNQLYYLDTLYSNSQTDLMPSDSLDSRNVTAFISLDLDGILKENHFLQVSYVDSEGHRIKTHHQTGNLADTATYSPNKLSQYTFCVDNNGDVIVIRQGDDFVYVNDEKYTFTNGLLSGMDIWVDGEIRFSVNPIGQPKDWNLQIFKFSSHFDRLKATRYIFENEQGGDMSFQSYPVHSMFSSSTGNVFFTARYSNTGVDTPSADIGNTTTQFVGQNYSNSLLVKCNENLNPVLAISYFDSADNLRRSQINVKSCTLDDAENKIFIAGSCGTAVNRPFISTSNDTIFSHNSAFVMCYDNNTGVLVSHAVAPSGTILGTPMTAMHHNIIARNNRIFCPLNYTDSILCGDSVFNVPFGLNSFGVIIFDYEGNPIDFININAPSSRGQNGNIVSLIDSTLYISGVLLASNADFGGNVVAWSGSSTAFVSKYVDTSFSYPYHIPTNAGLSQIDKNDIYVYPNPVLDVLHFEIPQGEIVKSCYVIPVNGLHYKEQIVGNTLNLEKYPTGIYYIEIITNNNIYTQKIIKL